jgi:hypothetical protein
MRPFEGSSPSGKSDAGNHTAETSCAASSLITLESIGGGKLPHERSEFAHGERWEFSMRLRRCLSCRVGGGKGRVYRLRN